MGGDDDDNAAGEALVVEVAAMAVRVDGWGASEMTVAGGG